MFEANAHSKFQVGWKEVSSECFAEVCKVLGADYSTYGVQSVEQVDEWEQGSNNYRVVYRLAGGIPHQFLLRRHILQGPDEIRASTAVIRHLRQNEIPTPAVLLADANRRFVECGGQYWQMFQFISGDHFRGEGDELALAATLIAQMHHAFDAFPDKRQIVSINAIMGPLNTAYWDVISFMEGANAFEDMLLEKRIFIQEEVARLFRMLSPSVPNDIPMSMYSPEYQVIHGDLHPQNFLFPEGQGCVILDFGNMCIADKRYDIAMALHRLVRQYIVYQGKPWQETLPEGIGIFLDAYQSVDSLVRQEITTLPVFMKGLLLRKMAGNLNHYRKGTRNWKNCLSQCARFLGYLEEVDVIQAALG